MLLYASVLHIPVIRDAGKGDARLAVEPAARRVSALVAALFAAFSSPLVMASTRGDFAGLSLLLLLAATYPALSFARSPRSGLLYISALFAGLAAAEYPGFLLALPLLGGWWLWLVWRTDSPAWRRLIMAGVLTLALWSFILLVMVGQYVQSPLAAWQGHDSFPLALWMAVRNQLMEAAYSVPKVGWLLILCMTVIPFMAVIFRGGHEPADFFSKLGHLALRGMLFALAVVILFDLRGSPLRLAGSRTLLLAPSLITAVWAGALVGGRYARLALSPKPWLRHLLLGLTLLVLLGAGVRQFTSPSVQAFAPVARFADELVAELGDRHWLVTDGLLDSNLRLSARRAGHPVRILLGEARPTDSHARYHESLFTDPVLRSLASADIRPLVTAWLGQDPSLAAQLASLLPPEALEYEGYQAVPGLTCYRLAPTNAVPQALDLLAEHQAYWARARLPDLAAVTHGQPGWLPAFFVVRWSSRLANDLGVYLEDQGYSAEAAIAYRQALSFWPDNMSAALNLLAQARHAGSPEAAELKTTLDGQAERNRKLFDLRYVPQLCGQIRNAAANLEEATALGRTGRRQQALVRLEQAAVMLDQDDQAGRFQLARLYAENEQPAESEAILKDLLVRKPDDLGALSGLFRIAVQRDDFARAGELLDQLAKRGLDARKVELEKARILLRSGKTDEARAALLALVRKGDVSIETWYNLGVFGLLKKDEEAWSLAAPALESDRYYLPGLLLLAERALRDRNLERARGMLEQALALDGHNRRTLEQLVQIHYAERNANLLRERSAQLLSLVPDHPLGHFGLGNVHLVNQRLDLAEASFRQVLARVENAQVQNDLAWILNETGRSDEALVHANRAVELKEEDGNIWDTLAGVYAKRGELDRAVECIEKAMSKSEGHSVSILMNACRIYHAADDQEKVRQTMDLLLNIRSMLPAARVLEIDRLRQEVDN